MRKIKYLLAVAVMSTSLLFGCGSNDSSNNDNKKNDKALTADEFIEKVENNDSEIKSADFKMSASIDASADETAVKASLTVDGSVDSNKNAKFDINIDAGDNGQQELTCYLAADGDNYVLYMQMMGQWCKLDLQQLTAAYGVDLSKDTAADNTSVDLKKVLEYLNGTEVKVSDDTYTLSGTIDFKKVFDAVAAVAGNNANMSAYEEQVNALADKVKINVKVSIDKDGQFKSFDMSVDKFEEDGLAVNELKLSISGSNYNNVADITIPDEAANATDIFFTSPMLGSVGGLGEK